MEGQGPIGGGVPSPENTTLNEGGSTLKSFVLEIVIDFISNVFRCSHYDEIKII